MPESPTTEGSIVAFLKLDDSDWNRKLDEAEQRARDLGRIDPTIRVHADTAQAIADLEAARMAASQAGESRTVTVTTVNDTHNMETTSTDVTGTGSQAVTASRTTQARADGDVAKAEKAMQDAMQKASLAAQAEEVAAMRLDDVQNRRGHTDTQVAAAELALQRAEARTAAAAAAARESGETLNATREASAAAAAAAAAGEDDVANASDGAGRGMDRAGNSAHKAGGYYRTVGVVIASLIPIMGPLAGYVAGVGGAFLGMGAAGVFAVLGIKNEMTAGTTQGQKYSALMTELTDDLHSMEDVAASGILAPFDTMVHQVSNNLPQLTSELDGFSHDLGQIGGTVVSTLISGFQTLNPLFQEGAGYIQHLATAWQGWVDGGGLNQFAADAEQELPIVAADLGNLLSIGVKLISGLAPLGTVVLQALEALSGAIDAIPTPVLVGLVSTAATVYGEFKLWGTLGPIITRLGRSLALLGVEEDAALGPIGLVIGAATALGVGIAGAALSTRQASQDTQDYTTALEQSNGAIDDNIRHMVAQKLQADGVLDTARKYGVSLSTVTSAVLGNAQAQDTVTQAIHKHGMETSLVMGAQAGMNRTTREMTTSAQKLSDTVNGQSKSFNGAIQSYRNISDASSTTAQGQSTLASQAAQVSSALAIQAGFATGLTNDLNLLNGVSLNNIQAATAQAAAINGVSSSFKTNGRAIDGTTAAAVANQQAIEQAVGAIDQHGEAVAKATGSQEKGTQAIEGGRDALLRQLSAQHLLTPAVQAFIDKVLAIPTARNVKVTADTVQAENALNNVQSLLDSLHSRDIVQTINVDTVQHTYGVGLQGASPSGKHAQGGTIGGPGTATSDSILSWLSRSEEVISNAKGQASRYRPLLKTINSGAAPQQVMAAAHATTGMSDSRPVVNQYHTWNVTAQDPVQMMQFFTSQSNRRAAV